jgi:hypothetical protein
MEVLVLHQLADELGAVGTQTRHRVLDVIDSEHDAAKAQRVHGRILARSTPAPTTQRFPRPPSPLPTPTIIDSMIEGGRPPNNDKIQNER